jgi:hypothetical protein
MISDCVHAEFVSVLSLSFKNKKEIIYWFTVAGCRPGLLLSAVKTTMIAGCN